MSYATQAKAFSLCLKERVKEIALVELFKGNYVLFPERVAFDFSLPASNVAVNLLCNFQVVVKVATDSSVRYLVAKNNVSAEMILSRQEWDVQIEAMAASAIASIKRHIEELHNPVYRHILEGDHSHCPPNMMRAWLK